VNGINKVMMMMMMKISGNVAEGMQI